LQWQVVRFREILEDDPLWVTTVPPEIQVNNYIENLCIFLIEAQLAIKSNAIFFSSFLVPGVDVMITIFCDFRQFSAKKMAFFSKTNVMIKILHILALF
jgi:hypothetical protein